MSKLVSDHMQANHRTNTGASVQLGHAQGTPLIDPSKYLLDATEVVIDLVKPTWRVVRSSMAVAPRRLVFCAKFSVPPIHQISASSRMVPII